MPHARRSSPEGVNGREDWLAADEWGRLRPWAYEEILFGSTEERARAEELAAVVDELETERVELAALHETLDLHLTRIAELERRLGELTGTASAEAEQTPPPPSPPTRERPTLPHPRSTALDDEERGSIDRNGATLDRRSRLLAQCEGFDVGAPGGPVGFVEGLRFGSRIDCPDVLEVRGGRFGRQLLLVPIDEVDEIHLADRCLVLRTTPVLASDLLDDLGGRLRRVLRFEHTAS